MPHRNSLHDLSLQPHLTGIWQRAKVSLPALWELRPCGEWERGMPLGWNSITHCILRYGLKKWGWSPPAIEEGKGGVHPVGAQTGTGMNTVFGGGELVERQLGPAQRKWVWYRQTVQMWLDRRRNVTNISTKILHWITGAIVRKVMSPLFSLSLNAALTSRLGELFLDFVNCRKDQSDLDSVHTDDLF